MKNLIDFRKMVEIAVDRRSASARDYPMERFKGAVKKNPYFGGKKVLRIYGWQKRTRMLYCRRKVKEDT